MGENKEITAYRDRTLTLVLEDVLEYIIKIYKNAKKDAKSVVNGGQLYAEDCIRIEYSSDDELVSEEFKMDNIHDIFNDMFTHKRANGENDSVLIEFGEYDKIFSKNIEHSFIDEKLKEELINEFKNFTDKVNALVKCNRFPSVSEIDECLEVYYKLLIDLMEGDYVKKRIVKKEFLRDLLMLYDTKIDNIEYMSLYSPMVLNNLQKMYRGVMDFCVTLFSSLKTDPISVEIAYMYKSILRAKVQRIFRWYLYDGELNYMAIPPKPLGNERCDVIRIASRKLSDCNSFEGIGELRFAEKIIEAYEKFSDEHSDEPLKVALIGDINNPFEHLKEYVEKRYDGINIKYTIFTKNKGLDKISEFANVTVNEENYDSILQSTEEMDKVLNENHVIFFLDCIGLYEELSVYDEKDIESSMQLYRLNSYNGYSNWEDDPQNIFASNPLDDLYQCIVAYMATGRLGKLEKEPKKQVLEYIENKINRFDKKEFKLAYVYVSDLIAFSNIYCREQYYMRVEQYNEKKIGIIRFSTLEEPSLENSNSNMIVLSAWQIIKHIALEDREDIIRVIKENAVISNCKIDFCNLHNMYIGLDYNNWKDSINVYYSYDLPDSISVEENEKFIKHFIKNIFMQVFKKPKGSIYQQYCKNVIISFLYGDSKSIEDILFVHLLKNNKVNLKNVIWNEHDKKFNEVLRERNFKYRFSSKRLYDLAMQCYDVAFVNILDEFNISELFEEEGISKQKYKKDILQACENIGYKDSNLYVNCL